MNLLKTNPKTSDLLLRMSTFELSSLVPTIRLSKIFHNPATKEETILELPFETTAWTVENIYETGAGRGAGYGITSVEWKQNPKNEAAVSTYKVAINMHLQSIEEFFIRRAQTTVSDGTILTLAIEDLLYQRKQWRLASNEGPAVYNPDYYTIKLVVGWEISESGLQSIRDVSNRKDMDDFIAALKDQKEVLYLTFVSHNIEFNEDGSIELQMNYFGRADSNSSNLEKSNVLTMGRSFEQDIDSINKEIRALEKEKQAATEKMTAQENLSDWTDSLARFGKVIGGAILGGAVAAPIGIAGAVAGGYAAYEKTKSPEEVVIGENEEKIKELQEKLTNLQRTSKLTKYNYLLTRMWQKKHVHLFVYDTKVIELLANLKGIPSLAKATDLRNFNDLMNAKAAIAQREQEVENERAKNDQAILGYRASTTPGTVSTNSTSDVTVAGREAIREATGTQTEADAGANPSVSPVMSNQVTNAVGAQAAFGANASVNEEVAKSNEELYELIENGDLISSAPLPKGKKQFAFFYFSSLVDALLEPIFNENKKNPNFINKKLRVILGPMTIVDYGSLQDNGKTYRIFETIEGSEEKEEKYVKVFEGTPKTINVGDVPISVREFQRWFNEHIVNKNITQMTFNEFISLLVNDLILASITNQVYTYAPKQKARFAISNFTSIAGDKNENAFASNIQKYKWDSGVAKTLKPNAGGFRIDQTALTSLKTNGKDIERDHDMTSDSYLPSKDYCVVYCINDAPYDRIGDYNRDKEDGILHFYAGDSRGTIRSLKFSRVDNPNRRAENILAGTSEGRGVSKIIREKYNVTIEVFGNTNIQAGNYIFVSPTYAGFQTVEIVEKKLRDIGLGGYYLVTEVNSNIESGDFRTTIKAVWAAFGDGTINDGDKQYAPPAPNAQIKEGILV